MENDLSRGLPTNGAMDANARREKGAFAENTAGEHIVETCGQSGVGKPDNVQFLSTDAPVCGRHVGGVHHRPLDYPTRPGGASGGNGVVEQYGCSDEHLGGRRRAGGWNPRSSRITAPPVAAGLHTFQSTCGCMCPEDAVATTLVEGAVVGFEGIEGFVDPSSSLELHAAIRINPLTTLSVLAASECLTQQRREASGSRSSTPARAVTAEAEATVSSSLEEIDV